MMVTGTGPFTRTSIRKDQQSAFDLASRLLALYECQLAFTAGAGGSG
jgi:hypothetical protein